MSDTRVSTRPYIIGPSQTSFVVPAASGGTTLDPAFKGTNVVLSSSNSVATFTGGSFETVISTVGSSGSFYFEAVCTTDVSGNWFFGFADHAQSMNTTIGFTGGDSASWAKSNGAMRCNGSITLTAFTGAVNVPVGVAVNVPLAKFWVTNDGLTWNNDIITNQNPVGNVGGCDISASFNLAGAPFYAALNGNNGDVIKAQFTPNYSYSAPFGYTGL